MRQTIKMSNSSKRTADNTPACVVVQVVSSRGSCKVITCVAEGGLGWGLLGWSGRALIFVQVTNPKLCKEVLVIIIHGCKPKDRSGQG
jgi:hypothetical protein